MGWPAAAAIFTALWFLVPLRAVFGAEDVIYMAGKITAVEILSNSGAECVIKYPNAKDLKVSGAKVKVLADDQISFATVKGKTYIIKNVSSL